MPALPGVLQPAHSVMHQKPPALRLPVPSLLCHQPHTPPVKEFPALQGTHGHRRLCPSLSLSSQFSWACLVCPAASQAQPWGVQQGGHSGDIQRCAKPLPSPALGAQTCYPRNHFQCLAEENPGNSVVPTVSKDAGGGRNLPGLSSQHQERNLFSCKAAWK